MESTIWPRLAILLPTAVLISGCNRPAPAPTSAPDTAQGAVPPVADQSGVPLSDADYQEFGNRLEAAVAAGDRATADRLFRVKEISTRANRELNLKLTPGDELRLKSIEARENLGASVMNQVKNGCSYSFVHVHVVDGQKRVLMRVISPDDALMYHDIILTRYPDGQVGAQDLYDFAKGEMMSRLLKEGTLTSLVTLYPRLHAQMTPDQQLFSKHQDAWIAMSRNVLGGRHREALTTFRALPADVQRLKLFQLNALPAAQGTTDEDYIAEMERFLRDHPDDGAADLVAVFYFLTKKQCDNTLKAIDRLDAKVGRDAYLSVVRSEALTDAGRYAEARTAAENAIKESPKLLQAYWARVTVALQEKNHADTLTWLKRAIETSGATPDVANMENNQAYAEFVKTPQFQELKRWLMDKRK